LLLWGGGGISSNVPAIYDASHPAGLARHLRFSANDVTEGSVPKAKRNEVERSVDGLLRAVLFFVIGKGITERTPPSLSFTIFCSLK